MMPAAADIRSRAWHAFRAGAMLAIALLAPALDTRAANEQALQVVWDQHVKAPQDHAAAIKVCGIFLEANPADPLAPIVRQIEAWHHLSAGRTGEAERLLEPYLTAPADALGDGAKLVARGWFSRLDYQRVTGALQAYYRKEVGYPKSLAEIVAHPKIPKSLQPPLADRFGKPWQYSLAGFGKVPGFENQRYALASATLGAASELAKALKLPYASGIDSPPLQVFDHTPPMVKFKLPGAAGTTAIQAGQQAGDIHLAYVGERIVVVCNHSYWRIYPRP